MSRTHSKIIGSICVVATALSLSVATPAISKGKGHKSGFKQPSQHSFRYNEYRSDSGVRSRNRRGASGQRSFRYNAFRSDNYKNSGVIGFPFRNSYGLSDGGNNVRTGNVEQSGNHGNSVSINEAPRAPLGLQLTRTFMEQRAPAKVLTVNNDLKSLGEERAERRRDRYDVDGDKRVFRFYRDNEAYDERFPSVVYLKSD